MLMGGESRELQGCSANWEESTMLSQGTWEKTEANLAKLLKVFGSYTEPTLSLFPPKTYPSTTQLLWKAAFEMTTKDLHLQVLLSLCNPFPLLGTGPSEVPSRK